MPELVCRTCSKDGVEHRCAHVVSVFEINGKPLPEPIDRCPHCGAASADLVLPTEQKLWLMQDVNPNEYEWDGGERRLKDWAQAELEARIGREDEDDKREYEQSVERQRARAQHARSIGKTQLTQAEIEQIDRAVREGILRADAEDAGLVLPK